MYKTSLSRIIGLFLICGFVIWIFVPYFIETQSLNFYDNVQSPFSSAMNGQYLWQTNGTTIVNASNNQYDLKIVSDTQGGAIIAWRDYRSGSQYDIYAQRIYANGSLAWNPNGTAICTIIGDETNLRMISDGLGGAILVWSDSRGGNSDIYAQQINSTGNTTWVSNGLVICNATGNQNNPSITSDGNHGAIIAWGDGRVDSDIYAQKISNTGIIQWMENGSAISATTDMESAPEILSDGNGGAFLVYKYEIMMAMESDLYIQHMNSTGNATWDSAGIIVSNDSGNQEKYQMILDNAGGIIISYLTTPTFGGDAHVWIQRFNSTGNKLWTTNGKQLGFSGNGGEDYPQLIEDGQNGAIVAWQDWRRGGPSDIYAQRVNSNGVSQWTFAGQVICNNSNSRNPNQMQIHPDNNSGAFVVWQEMRATSDIMIQRIDQNGLSMWEENGTILCNANNMQYSPIITTNGKNGIIVAWIDNRGTTMADIFAQQIAIPPNAPVFTLSSWNDNDGIYNIVWSTQFNALNYTLYRYSGPILAINSSVIKVGVFTNTEYLETGMNEGTYYYAVIATNNVGNSSLSNSLLVIVDIPGPNAPVLSVFSPNPDLDGNITIEWNDVPYADNYTVYKYSEIINSSNVNSATILKSGLVSSQWEETGLTNGTYFYAIRAFNNTGISSLSNSESVVISILPPTDNSNSNSSPNPPPDDNEPPNSLFGDFPWWILFVIGGISIAIYFGKKKSSNTQ